MLGWFFYLLGLLWRTRGNIEKRLGAPANTYASGDASNMAVQVSPTTAASTVQNGSGGPGGLSSDDCKTLVEMLEKLQQSGDSL